MNLPKHITANPDEIVFSLTNPRRHGGDFTKRPDWPDFLESVKQHGVKQWPLVRLLPKSRTDAAAKGRKYELIAGDRRVTASQLLKLPQINLVIEDLDDAKVIEIQQIENLQREDLSPLEEAQGYADWRDSLIKAGTCKTVEAAVAYIADKINKKRTTVFNRLALLRLNPPVREALIAGKIAMCIANEIAKVPAADDQAQLLEEAIGNEFAEPLSVRELQAEIERTYVKSLAEPPFDLKRIYVGIGNPCTSCPKRTGNMKDLFPDLKNPNVCTDVKCYAAKHAAHNVAMLDEAKAKGHRTMTWEEFRKNQSDLVGGANWSYEAANPERWSKLMGKHAPKPIIVLNEEGELMEMYTRAEVKEAAIKNGIKFPEPKKVEKAPVVTKYVETAAAKIARIAAQEKQRKENEAWDAQQKALAEKKERMEKFVLTLLSPLVLAIARLSDDKSWQIVNMILEFSIGYEYPPYQSELKVKAVRNARVKALYRLFGDEEMALVTHEGKWNDKAVDAWIIAGIDPIDSFEKAEKATKVKTELPQKAAKPAKKPTVKPTKKGKK